MDNSNGAPNGASQAVNEVSPASDNQLADFDSSTSIPEFKTGFEDSGLDGLDAYLNEHVGDHPSLDDNPVESKEEDKEENTADLESKS